MATTGKIQRGPTSQNDRLVKLCLYADFHAFIAKCTILPNFALSNWTIYKKNSTLGEDEIPASLALLRSALLAL